MIWILAVLFILIIIQVVIIGVCFSSLALNVKECEIAYNERFKGKLEIVKSKVSIDVFLFKKIKILSIEIHEDYCEIFKMKLHFNLLKKLKSDKESGISYVIKNIWRLDPEIKNMNLNIYLGSESVMLNVFVVPFISTLLSGIITNYSNNKDISLNTEKSNIKFKIMPKFIDKNVFNLKLTTKIYFDTITTLFFIKKHQEI